ncbi:MAG: hypothetical protein MJ070_11520 [Lachnospiraceae bacterium]|nr:hypothetical protein [Lachnospiraceae bacterium]
MNDVFRCAERDGVMRPSDVMCASRVKVTLAEHIASLCAAGTAVEAAKHHCGDHLPLGKCAITSLRPQHLFHKCGQTSHHPSETGSSRKPRAFLSEAD